MVMGSVTSGLDFEWCAISSAVRFAIEPPLVGRPCAGRSSAPVANQFGEPGNYCEFNLGWEPVPERHDVWFAFMAEAI